jgi:general secretion pathway protein M
MTRGSLASRLLAVLILIVVIAGLWSLAALPLWRTYTTNRALIEEHRNNIERFGRIAATTQELEAALARLERRPEVRSFTLEDQSPTLAAATLQERVKRLVESAGGRLTSTQVLESSPVGGFQKVGINVRMSVDVAAFQQVLHGLETGLPVMLVDEVIVLARRTRRRSRRKGPEPPSLLDVRFELSGYLRAASAGSEG